MSDAPAFCPKCGTQVMQGTAFCPKCGASLSGGAATPTGAPTYAPAPRHEKGEKQEKHEKEEKGRGGEITGPLIGGGILIWLGTLVYLQNQGTIRGGDFGGLFLMGIGVLLILGGLIRRTRSGYPAPGFIIGGIITILIGIGSLEGLSALLGAALGPLVLAGLGVVIIVVALTARRKSPAP